MPQSVANDLECNVEEEQELPDFDEEKVGDAPGAGAASSLLVAEAGGGGAASVSAAHGIGATAGAGSGHFPERLRIDAKATDDFTTMPRYLKDLAPMCDGSHGVAFCDATLPKWFLSPSEEVLKGVGGVDGTGRWEGA